MERASGNRSVITPTLGERGHRPVGSLVLLEQNKRVPSEPESRAVGGKLLLAAEKCSPEATSQIPPAGAPPADVQLHQEHVLSPPRITTEQEQESGTRPGPDEGCSVTVNEPTRVHL